MRMKHVTREELANMDAASDRCALELSDARVDVLGYACLVAIDEAGQIIDVSPGLLGGVLGQFRMLRF